MLPDAAPETTARPPAGNGEAEPAVASFCSAERSPRPAGIVASMSEPARASFDATRRAWWSEGTGENRRCGRGVYPPFLSPQERWSPAGARPGQSPPTEGNPRTKQQGSKPGPRPAPGRRMVSGCRARNEGTTPAGNGEAEPATAFPSAAPSAACVRRELSRRFLRPARASFDATRRAWVERGHRQSRRCGRALSLSIFLVATRKMVAPGETRPITADRRQPETKQQGSKAWTPACAGATNRARMPCPKRRPYTPPAMAKPSRQQPSPSAAPSAARGRRELSRRCLSPPGRVSTRPAGRGWSEGTGEAGAAAGGVFIHLSCRHKKDGHPPGRDPANHRRPTAPENQTAGSKPWTPACAGATNRVRMPRPRQRQRTPPAMAKPSRQQPSPSAAPSGAAAGGNCRVDV